MHKRFVATTVLGIALLFSQGGNFLVAALCPHLQSGTASCETQKADPEMSHENMGHAGHMATEPEIASKPYPDTDPHSNSAAIGKQHGPCSHCAVHSNTSPKAVSLRETESAKRVTGLSIPLQVSKVAPITASPVAVLTSRAHGPPGKPPARYILINIFRI